MGRESISFCTSVSKYLIKIFSNFDCVSLLLGLPIISNFLLWAGACSVSARHKCEKFRWQCSYDFSDGFMQILIKPSFHETSSVARIKWPIISHLYLFHTRALSFESRFLSVIATLVPFVRYIVTSNGKLLNFSLRLYSILSYFLPHVCLDSLILLREANLASLHLLVWRSLRQ